MSCDRCGKDARTLDHNGRCPACEPPELTAIEFAAVTEAFVARLHSAMGSAGCNDVFPDEFPKSVCQKYRNDFDVLEMWNRTLLRTLGQE